MINVTGSDPQLVQFVVNGFIKYEQNEKDWAEQLKRNGVKAAHPDDGWVNREINNVNLCYPQLFLNPQIGDIIALGTHEKWRLVRVTKLTETYKLLLNQKDKFVYYFEDAGFMRLEDKPPSMLQKLKKKLDKALGL